MNHNYRNKTDRPRRTAVRRGVNMAAMLCSLAGAVVFALLFGSQPVQSAPAGRTLESNLAQEPPEIMFDFTNNNGQPLKRGDIVSSITQDGLTMFIEVDSNGNNDVAMIFDTSNPGPDPDLGSPNEKCPGGGPGVGVGGEPGQPGENCTFLGNVLIIPTSVGPNVAPNDDNAGGTVILTFSQPVTVLHTEVLDIEENGLDITFYNSNGVQIGEEVSPTGLGDNSFEKFMDFGADTIGNVLSIHLFFPGSGAFAGLAVTPDDPIPGLIIKKYTNGQDADNPNGEDVPQLEPGDPITWTYRVTNTGTVAYPAAEVTVTDSDPAVTPAFDSVIAGDADTILEPGEVWQYIAFGTASNLESLPPSTSTIVQGCQRIDNEGQPETVATYENIGTVTTPDGQDSDLSHWCNTPEDGILIEKLTNGADADDPNGADVPRLEPGDPITWTYQVTNIGELPYTAAQVVVTDDQLDENPVRDPASDAGGDGILSPGETWIYIATGTAPDLETVDPTTTTVVDGCQQQVGGDIIFQRTYRNIGTVTVPGGITDSDPSHWCNPFKEPGILIEKRTNGMDADDPDGVDVPQILPGQAITWTYVVTNTGETTYPAAQVTVTDSDPNVTPVFDSVLVGDADTLLEPGEVWLYIATGAGVDLLAPPPTVTTVDGVCTRGDVTVPPTTAYVNTGAVIVPGTSAEDNSSYCPADPGLAAERVETFAWEYGVINDGQVNFASVGVNAGPDVAVTCPQGALAAGSSMQCTTESAAYAFHRNIAWAVGTPGGGGTIALDWVLEEEAGDLQLQVYISDQVASLPPGVRLSPGVPFAWRYVVRNTGSSPLTQIDVVEESGLTVDCPGDSLAPGAEMTCMANSTAQAGPHVHPAQVTAQVAAGGEVITATTRGYYVGQ